VIVWDAGTWRPGDGGDPRRAVETGELHFDLEGQKLRGRFVLVRTRTDGSGKEQWLLLHKNDEFAVHGWDPEDHPRSVLSGRTNDQVKADPDRLWRSDLPAARASQLLRAPTFQGPTDDEPDAPDSFGGSGTWAVFGGTEHAPIPERRAGERVLAKGVAAAPPGVAAPLGQPGRRSRGEADLPGGG